MSKKVEINFKCKKCKKTFDCDVGEVSVNMKTYRPIFTKPILCPRCGERTMDEVLNILQKACFGKESRMSQ